MAVRQVSKNSVHIPDDAIFLEFPRSDGAKSNWPSNTNRVVDGSGAVNYMSPQTSEGAPSPIWRRGAGMHVALNLKMEGAADGSRTYVLKNWPEGYGMFIHYKGEARRPRSDPYLFGSGFVNKFRSSNEFAPHALWLFTDETLNHANCECKYNPKNKKKSQTAISQELGLKIHRSAGDSPAPSAGPRPRGRPKRDARPKATAKPYTAVRKTVKVKKAPAPTVAVIVERDADIREALIQSDVQAPRMYRTGEVIWCRLDDPIHVSDNSNDTISFWPGVVEDIVLKSDTKPAPTSSQMDVDSREEEVEEEVNDGARKSRRIRAKQQITWTVTQFYQYKVKLLATTHSCSIADASALPYLAYQLPVDLISKSFTILNSVLHGADVESMDRQIMADFDFDPYQSTDGMDPSQRFRDAVVPYTLAVEMAKNLTCYWTPTDQYDYTFVIPPLPPNGLSDSASASTSSSSAHFQSLHTAIQAAMDNNGRGASGFASGANGKSRTDIKETANNLLGNNIADQMPSSLHAAPRTVTQTRYQGLWWGAERIWTDELVRLKLARYQFAPNGAPAVNPPAGMSASTSAVVDQMNSAGLPAEAFSAGERGMFMKIEGLFVAELQTPEGVVKECRASGMVYELADYDWEPSARVEGSGEGKGKEKATNEDAPPSISQPGTPVKAAPSSQDENASPGGNGVLSTPPRHHYGLPAPPAGFKFNPILPPGHEVVLSLSLISGRYYPKLLNHPLLVDTVQKHLVDEQSILDGSYLWALQGSMAGIYQSMDPQHWKTDRHIMLAEADEAARTIFGSEWQAIKTQRLGGVPGSGAEPQPAGSGDMDVQMEDRFEAGGGSTTVIEM
ncbi:hypothetical protein BXZ70DRAFT_1010503 [Cristinia sonorae]|uniref:Cryptic loci regulator 2 C-terminal domain-containing protein n=1 Tax=Cristinia sonorae TaxID=1940300 RepID=A0A8K0UI70_9AGAR|nr:hypothetical protein BXZ70DRAFT_1010503 [Cristinia sonorae]